MGGERSQVSPRLLPLLLLCLLAICVPAADKEADAQTAQSRPNIVVVMADDLGVDSSDMISGLQSFGASGATFENSFVSNSLCCPSRATFLRGQYSNNHGTITNWAPVGAYPRFVRDGRDRDNLVVRLNSKGYLTGHYGKYLNGYGGGKYGKPPGWDRFVHVNDGDRYWEDGAWGTFSMFHDDYTIQRSVDFVQSTKGQSDPFYLQVDLHSPHAPYSPPLRYAGRHAGTVINEKPSFSEDLSDKPQWVRDTRAWMRYANEPDRLERSKENRRQILEETEVVADALARISAALSSAGKGRNTYIVFTSDNGYQLGEHGLPFYKMTPYEESVRVPLMIRGPGIAAGANINEMVVNNDLAPTILDWADAGIPSYMDGRSLDPLARGSGPTGRDNIMVEHWVDTHQNGDTTPPPIPFYKMVRTSSGEVYVEYSTGEREYYDLTTDPYQMDNGAGNPQNAARISELQDRLNRLKDCSGASCRAAEGGTIDVEINAPDDNSYDTDGIVSLSGTAGANSTVEVLEGTTPRATTAAGVREDWNATLRDVPQGRHTYVAKATDGTGKTLSSEPRTVTVDTVEPRLSGFVPRPGAAGVWPGANVTATFSEAMRGTTVNRTTFRLSRKGTAVEVTVGYNAATRKATLNPNKNLVPGATYVASVNTGARDLAGNPLDQRPTVAGNQSMVWAFTVRR